MNKFKFFFLILFFTGGILSAQNLPNMKNQSAWTEKDKKDFLNYIKSSNPMPEGQVKYFSAAPGKMRVSKPAFASLGFLLDNVVRDEGTTSKTETAFGVKVLGGGHLFSWVRYYAGLKYSRFNQDKLDGKSSDISHWELPLGLELALIPLGTPQTRYIVLRAGVSQHYFRADAKESDFKNSLLGWTPAWNLGLGYEWQIPNSNWRINILSEGYRSISTSGHTPFYGLGLNSGIVYTF